MSWMILEAYKDRDEFRYTVACRDQLLGNDSKTNNLTTPTAR
jgi:hypothetical protein